MVAYGTVVGYPITFGTKPSGGGRRRERFAPTQLLGVRTSAIVEACQVT
jgi:hypothetical protein